MSDPQTHDTDDTARDRAVTDGRARDHARRHLDAARLAHIPGWGADRRREDRPAVPMERTPPRLESPPAGLPPPQRRSVEVLHSTERPGLTPVYGTTVPPAGLSGVLRRHAYGWSENDLRRWLTLLAADRVDVLEGVLDDLRRGHVPNVYAEMGGRAELRHNPAGAARKAAVLVLLAGAAVWWWQRGRR